MQIANYLQQLLFAKFSSTQWVWFSSSTWKTLVMVAGANGGFAPEWMREGWADSPIARTLDFNSRFSPDVSTII